MQLGPVQIPACDGLGTPMVFGTQSAQGAVSGFLSPSQGEGNLIHALKGVLIDLGKALPETHGFIADAALNSRALAPETRRGHESQ